MWLRISMMVGTVWLVCGTAVALPPGVGDLTWSDEFSGDELDLTKWFHRATGPRQDGYLTPEAVSVSNGALTIKTYTEGGVNYSGMVGNYPWVQNPLANNYNGHEQTYGYFEVRAKFHTTSGSAAAFWLQSPTIGNPIGNPGAAGVEIDIFEHRVHNPLDYSSYPGLTPTTDITNRVNQAVIWNGYGPEQQLTKKLSNTLPGLSNDVWRTFGLKWTPTSYTFYYEGIAIWTGGGAPISHADEYVILSSEVIEAFAGAIPAGGYGARGDFNHNGLVDAADYVLWRRAMGQTVGRGSGADANADGMIGQEDYEIWRANIGRTASSTDVQFDYVRIYDLAASGAGSVNSESIPEPCGLALLGIGMFWLCSTNRQTRAAPMID